MRMARDGRLRKPCAGDWSQIFRRLLSAEVWRSFMGQVGAEGDARTRWRPKYVVLCWVLMSWGAAATLGERFRLARDAIGALFADRRRPGDSMQSVVKAGGKLTSGAFLWLWRILRLRLARRLGRAWHWHGWTVFAVDGSRIETPRTRANERGLGCAGRDKSGPQWWVTVLVHLPSRLFWSWRQGPAASSERHHLRDMLNELPADALLLADAGFVGFDLLSALVCNGTDFLIRCGANLTLLIDDARAHCETIGAEQRVTLWPLEQRRRKPLTLRLITLKTGAKSIHLLTNVRDPTRLPRRIAGELYAARWGVELHYRALKQTLGRRRLQSRTPASGALELAGNILGLGLLQAHAAWLLRGESKRASVAQLLRVLRAAVEALVYQCGSGWFVARARAALRDTYARRTSKRARDWPHKKTNKPPGSPKLRRMTTDEKTEIQRWNNAEPRQIG